MKWRNYWLFWYFKIRNEIEFYCVLCNNKYIKNSLPVVD